MAGLSAKRSHVRTAYAHKVVVVQRVCTRIEGGENLTEVCRDPTMPGRTTVVSWAVRYPELRERLEAAQAAVPEARRAYHYYCEEVIAEFLARIEDGRGLAEVCAEADMPAHCSITRWLNERPEFAARYRRAREAQADRLFDLAWRIACEAEPRDVWVAKLKIDTIKWRIGRLVPRKYGPWKAVAPDAPDAAARRGIPPQMKIRARDWSFGPGGQVVETTRLTQGLSPEDDARVDAAIAAGRFRMEHGQVAEVFLEDGGPPLRSAGRDGGRWSEATPVED